MSTTVADALRSIADLVEGGMPAPSSISVDFDGGVEILLYSEDLTAWAVLMDLPAPVWVPKSVAGYAHASWPADTFADLPFALAACRRVEAPALRVVSS